MDRQGQLATVVIINYNYGQYIAAAIDSALRQSHVPLEVVVVDDGSTDSSRQVIAGYEDRVRTIFQDNGGQGAAYNAGWAAARGKFVLFLDSDDVLTPDAVLKIVAAFERSDAVKVQFYLEQVDRDLNSLGCLLPAYEFPRIEPRKQIANYGYYVSPPASGNAFRKSFLDAVMPIADEKLYRHAADGFTTGLAGLAGHVESIPERLGFYRVHGENYGGAGGVKSMEHLHHMFMRDIKRENTQHEFANCFNFHFAADRSRYCPGHTKLRLLSRRMFPEAHPIKADEVGALVLCGLVSALKFPHLTFTKRFMVAIGFIMLGVVPRAMLRPHFNAVTSPQQQHKIA
jgi:glycosyltransferase involved in cell wall biosynthesis